MESAALKHLVTTLTVKDLQAICLNLAEEKAQQLLMPLTKCLLDFEILTRLRIAAFLAQLAVESGEFRYSQEIWGPTDQQKKYDPPGDVAHRLGNIREGDGYRYRGRGYIQLTGRFNYEKYGQKLGLDLISYPEMASQPEVAFKLAGQYWIDHKLNEKADACDFRGITEAINGGLNHHLRRLVYYTRAKKVLGAKTS